MKQDATNGYLSIAKGHGRVPRSRAQSTKRGARGYTRRANKRELDQSKREAE